mmetsp:Transcript_8943/g.54997  ORF Transcript_8943/g.54997 Transcript_8943/m.54997 type:complete len:272 (-) Transcript_8943:2054-2869(-)
MPSEGSTSTLPNSSTASSAKGTSAGSSAGLSSMENVPSSSSGMSSPCTMSSSSSFASEYSPSLVPLTASSTCRELSCSTRSTFVSFSCSGNSSAGNSSLRLALSCSSICSAELYPWNKLGYCAGSAKLSAAFVLTFFTSSLHNFTMSGTRLGRYVLAMKAASGILPLSINISRHSSSLPSISKQVNATLCFPSASAELDRASIPAASPLDEYSSNSPAKSLAWTRHSCATSKSPALNANSPSCFHLLCESDSTASSWARSNFPNWIDKSNL